ncbi:c-type cytochrome [Panacibacter sp. KCS-6]|uniref:C-type cytochrome n=2 Tax=Limnovirga soli TaxID=2656915 RepID=A0A8J8FE70_9BACT|nr:c-type cytochrome [Limnovirga soli]
MIHLRSIMGKLTFIAAFCFFVLFSNQSFSQDGKALFSQNCASCHAINKDLTGPALAGVEDRWPDKKMLYSWIKNNQAVIKSGYPYAVDLYNKWNKTQMNLFTSLPDKDIDAILGYIKVEGSKPAVDPNKPVPGGVVAEEGDNTLLFGILTLILAIVAFVLLQVNANLKKLADDKEGIPATEPVPVWRNKVYIMFATLVLFTIGGYYTVMGAIGLGRSQDYQPEQPIFYSHKVHAGTNQISCLYCHGGAQESKHANIPSVNVCMNCHMAINEYKGEALYTAEGEEVNGTNEIKKLYKYAGYEEGKPWDATKAKPVEWVKIHSLPDHVYFNHSQHVAVGKVQCQTCHGEITKMNEVYQFADLSMGWCINCHRETKVQFADNGFYSIYEKYHEDMKNGTMDSVTVANIGGTECQKCHY